MIIATLVFLLTFQIDTDIPFKPNEEFQLTLDYKFKQKPIGNNLTVDYTRDEQDLSRKSSSAGPLPYLIINLTVLKLSEVEVRVKVVGNDGRVTYAKKIKAGDTFKLDLGYTDDMKDQVSPHEYDIFFMTADKKEKSRVNLLIQPDGTFLINGEKRGKF